MGMTPAIISKLPVEYRTARQAMAKLTRISDVKTYRAKAISMEVFAYQAKDIELIGPAITAKKMAERRIGELIAEQRSAGTLAKAGRIKKSGFQKPRFPT